MANIYKLSFTGKEIDEKLTNIDIFENRIAALETGGAGGGSDNATSTFVNVQDFGAVGDGITDDTRAIQDALDSGIGRTVYFPSGTYLLKTALFNANTFGNCIVFLNPPNATDLYSYLNSSVDIVLSS
jgi:polygalacturonase